MSQPSLHCNVWYSGNFISYTITSKPRVANINEEYLKWITTDKCLAIHKWQQPTDISSTSYLSVNMQAFTKRGLSSKGTICHRLTRKTQIFSWPATEIFFVLFWLWAASDSFHSFKRRSQAMGADNGSQELFDWPYRR